MNTSGQDYPPNTECPSSINTINLKNERMYTIYMVHINRMVERTVDLSSGTVSVSFAEDSVSTQQPQHDLLVSVPLEGDRLTSVMVSEDRPSQKERHIVGTSFNLNRHLFSDIGFFMDYIGDLPMLKDKPVVRFCHVPTARRESFVDRVIIHTWMRIHRPTWQVNTLFIRDNQVSMTREQLMEQDVVFVGGGDTAYMLRVWATAWVASADGSRDGLVPVLREMYNKGCVMCGTSAGCICWFEEALSDSKIEPNKPASSNVTTSDGLHVIRCLGWLRGSCTPHFDERRTAYEQRVEKCKMSAGLGVPDGSLVHFVNESLNTIKQRRSAVHIPV